MAGAQPIVDVVVTLLIAIVVMSLLVRLVIRQPRPRPVRVRQKD